MSKYIPTRPCTQCNGTGRILLNGELLATYRLLSRKQGRNGAELGRLANVDGAAMCNRLQTLRKWGIAECVWHGREKRWYLTNKVSVR